MDPTKLSIEQIESYPVWDIDPDLLNIGPITIRFYGVLFATGIILGYYLWRWQMNRGNHKQAITEKFLVWGIIAVLAGSRLGHCLFYEPEIYLRNPLKILEIWKGGLASHGATIGLIVALWGFSRWYKFSVMEIFDRFSMSACMGAIFVRLGNFMNSEIVGRVWDGPWALRFPSYENQLANEWLARQDQPVAAFSAIALPRHPSQLYEALGGLAVFLLLYLIDRTMKEKRPRGLLAAVFMLGYFSFRFMIEFVKEYQRFMDLEVDLDLGMVFVKPNSAFDMGQYLSIPMLLIGAGFLYYALKYRHPASMPSPLDADGPEPVVVHRKSKKR